MKKILSMLLTLIMFLGLFVSCENEEISSSQSETKSETSSESESPSFIYDEEKNDSEAEKQDIYYEELSELGVCKSILDLSTEDFLVPNEWVPLLSPGWKYVIFTNYDEFVQILYPNQRNCVDATIFEDNVVFATLHYSDESLPFECVGYRDLVIEGTTLMLERDCVPREESSKDLICKNFYIIPKSEFGETSPKDIAKIKVNDDTFPSNEENDSDLENQDIYYEELSELEFDLFSYPDELNPFPPANWKYAIFTNYDELAQELSADQNDNFDATIFENNVVLATTYTSGGTIFFGYTGYRDLVIEGTTLMLECDCLLTEEAYGHFMSKNYYLIPRSEFGNISLESITEIKVNINTIPKD
ncbi:MAG: hypothetical protein IJZ04_02425 [Clostridia bacterium]|nr:hypothetical protein [Clostridia bacterium]